MRRLLPPVPTAVDEIRRVVTVFRELRSGVTEDGRTTVKSPSGTLSTAFTTTDARAGRAAVYEIHVHQLATTPETGRQIVNAIREYENTSGRRLA